MPISQDWPEHQPTKPDFVKCEHESVSWDACPEDHCEHTIDITIEGTCDSCYASVYETVEVEYSGWDSEEEICSECESCKDDCCCWICERCGDSDGDENYCGECACDWCGEDSAPPMKCLTCGEPYACPQCYDDGTYPTHAAEDYCLHCYEIASLTPEVKNQLAKAETLEKMARDIREKLVEET